MIISGKKLYIILSAIGAVIASLQDECDFVNELLGNESGTDCCSMGYPCVKCSEEHVTYINLSDQNIKKEFPSNANLPELRVLNLQGNSISGELPDISGLSGLVELNLSDNQIRNIPDSIEKLKNLKVLNLHKNIISTFQEKLVNLPNLTDLILTNNQIDGTIPESIGSFKNLRVLKLSNNKLSGSIPDSITSIKTLTVLDLSKNKDLGGNIPNDIDKLTNLRILNLNKCGLEGFIPTAALENLTNMAEINLSDNNELYGKIPDIVYDDNNYVCKFKGTSLCFVTKSRSLCEYTSYDCTNCVENAELVDNVCTCKKGYAGIGYLYEECNAQPDTELNNSGGNFRISFEIITFTTFILIASFLLM